MRPRAPLHAVLGLSLVTFAAAAPLAAQARVPDIATHADWPQANPDDVKSPDALIAALYDVISGPAGAPRNWTRFKSLFVPSARLMPSIPRDSGRRADLFVWSPDEYIAVAGPTLGKDGFFERESARTTEAFGNIMHVFSTYESRRSASDAQPFQRGINSIQVLKDGNRWWVVSIFWDSEKPANPIPAKYLPK